MVDTLEREGIGMTSQRTRDRLIARLQSQGIKDFAVLDAMRQIPRHLFVDEALAHRAYEDTVLPIGNNQTISQPYIVATMTAALLADGPVDNVLEIGTGCGYQTAILASVAKRVCTIERIRSLQAGAESRLRELGFRNIEYRHGDGAAGWKDRAPFDAIMLTASPTSIPNVLLSQLAVGGRMILPLETDGKQYLHKITRTEDDFVDERLEAVLFVPLKPGVRA